MCEQQLVPAQPYLTLPRSSLKRRSVASVRGSASLRTRTSDEGSLRPNEGQGSNYKEKRTDAPTGSLNSAEEEEKLVHSFHSPQARTMLVKELGKTHFGQSRRRFTAAQQGRRQ